MNIQLGLSQISNSQIFDIAREKIRNSKIFEKEPFRVYSANIFKFDKTLRDQGVLWQLNKDVTLLLPKDQFRKWKRRKLLEKDLKFIEVPNKNIKLLKIHPKYDLRKSTIIGAGIGIIVGIPIGLVRQSQYDKEGCEGTGDRPSWVQCFGGRNRLINNITFWGITGGLMGLIAGSAKINIKIGKGKNSFEEQQNEIKKYVLFHE